MNFENELHIGTPNPECACCLKHFSKPTQRRMRARIQPIPGLNAFFEYDICETCSATAKRSGKGLKRVVRAVMKYHKGEVL
ncbi:MAG: hypothetical protein RBS35_12025 [Azonexus sp.]|jgi:hypothetical protein|nr:hypothetical protein [Azonexus sp.]